MFAVSIFVLNTYNSIECMTWIMRGKQTMDLSFGAISILLGNLGNQLIRLKPLHKIIQETMNF